MSDYELIDILCATTSILADVIKRQREIIKQHEIETPELSKKENEIWKNLDTIEYKLRRR